MDEVTPESIREYIAGWITGGDPESSHENEDHLYLQVLKAIAHGTCEDPKACAAEAIKTKSIKFDRWYA